MKKYMLFGMVMSCAITTQADLIITEVMSSSSHTNTLANGDWFELYNSGASAIDLTGYSWDDNTATAGSADFNGLTINAGQAVIVCQETVGLEQSWLDLWGVSGVTVVNLGNTEFQNFGSTGDELHLYDASSNQLTYVTFGAATTGYSFEWDTSGNSLGVSVYGENGAIQSTSAAGGPDTASPGTVVPEPSVLAFLGLGGLLVFLRHRICA